MTQKIHWKGQDVPFRSGESVASALQRAGVQILGHAATGQSFSIFCGIGQCQGCLIEAEGRVTEACLLPCREGMALRPVDGGTDV